MFTRKDFVKLLIPLIIEQVLAVTIGMADTVMVASCGEAAVSGISLVDSISILLIGLFSAFATGGAVVAAQHLGNQDNQSACHSAKQLFLFSAFLSGLIAVIALVGNRHILSLIFGDVEQQVMKNAMIYFTLSAISYPFLAIYNAGAALFRSMGNSKVSMYTSVLMNVINLVGNAVTIYGFGMGTAGAGTATMLARIIGAVIMVALLVRPEYPIHLQNLRDWRPEFGAIRTIMKIGIPTGLEGSLFQLGKILVQSLIASFGTAAITASAVASNISGLVSIPATAIGLGMITIVGQCIGAGNKRAAKRYTLNMTLLAIAGNIVLSLLTILAIPVIVSIYALTAQTAALTQELLVVYCIVCMVLWPISFTMPNGLRAAGDAKFTMIVSIASVWLFRIGCSYLFALTFDMGIMGVWYAMYVDWVVRAICFTIRFCGKKWLDKKVI